MNHQCSSEKIAQCDDGCAMQGHRECDLTVCCFETGQTTETARLSEMPWRPSCLDRKSQFVMLCHARGFVRLAVTPLPDHPISVFVDIGAN